MQCEDCGYSTTRQEYMAVHMRGHAGRRVFSCEESGCSAVFLVRRSLVVHERKHTGERPFVCSEPACPYTTTSKLLLTAHTKCLVPECGYASCSRAALTAHSRAVHNFNPPPRKPQRLYTGPE